jgi:hypothetical protein
VPEPLWEISPSAAPRPIVRLRRLSWNGHCEFITVPLRLTRIFPAFLLIACAAAVYVAYRRRPVTYGSNTNASDAVDAPFIAWDASADEVLDVGVEYTFPASDPVAISTAYQARLKKEDLHALQETAPRRVPL